MVTHKPKSEPLVSFFFGGGGSILFSKVALGSRQVSYLYRINYNHIPLKQGLHVTDVIQGKFCLN